MEDYARVLRQRWVAILSLTITGLIVAAAFTWLQTPQFRASSQLFVTVQPGSSAADASEGIVYAEKRVSSYVSLATSPRVLQGVSQELGLNGGVQALTTRVTASSPPQTAVIDISATDPNPQQAAKLANSTAKQLITAVDDIEDVDFVRLRVIEEALVPSTPYSPSVPLNIALGVLFGLIVGIGYAYLREILDTRVRSRTDVERIVKAAVLGTFKADASVKSEPAVIPGERFGQRAESFRQLRTHLHFTNLDGGAQTVVVSSSIPGEGRTFIATNLAIMLAENGTKVLLVDADLRRPKVARYLGLDGSVGLTNVLSHTDAVEDVIQKWGPEGGLHVLASGSAASNPSKLVGSPDMQKLIARFETDYEVVVIAAPPLLPVSDSAVLGSMASGVVLVIGADGRTTSADISEAISNLTAVNARLLGVVLNKVDKGSRSHANYEDVPRRRGLRKAWTKQVSKTAVST
ncbi:polysaccharide biosynthesis tyrosine autokinase [Arthrobacter sp. W4I7]|uniref:polysaccharide biosynthesis tyrosine autokinase n=1 Tax=Arthrobacter sp. W4I7 TaxID=3042296 RepID=UPI0027D8A13F|nr:polysaccharide biosynthesis tyrosine autokinase [Arthrobacter sp. W4I7]